MYIDIWSKLGSSSISDTAVEVPQVTRGISSMPGLFGLGTQKGISVVCEAERSEFESRVQHQRNIKKAY